MKSQRLDPGRSRRILGWTLAGFFAIQFVAGLALDYVWPEIRFPLMQSMLSRLAAEPRSPDAIILGSSRFQTSLNARELTNAVRAATGDSKFRAFDGTVVGSDCISMEHALNTILVAGHRPRLLIIEICPTAITRNTRWYTSHINRQIRWDNAPTHFREIVGSGELGRFVLARAVPLYRHRYEIIKTIRTAAGLLPSEQKPVPAAYSESVNHTIEILPNDVTPASDTGRSELASLDIGTVRREIRDFAPSSNALDALNRMLARCKSHGIAVILVGAPVSEAYREAIHPVSDLYHGILKQIHAEHGVEFIDAHAALPDALFVDYHHTTPKGGVLFARQLARQSIAPFWSALHPCVPAQLVNRPR